MPLMLPQRREVIEYAQEHLTNGHDMVKSLKLGHLIDIKAEEPDERQVPQRQIVVKKS